MSGKFIPGRIGDSICSALPFWRHRGLLLWWCVQMQRTSHWLIVLKCAARPAVVGTCGRSAGVSSTEGSLHDGDANGDAADHHLSLSNQPWTILKDFSRTPIRKDHRPETCWRLAFLATPDPLSPCTVSSCARACCSVCFDACYFVFLCYFLYTFWRRQTWG